MHSLNRSENFKQIAPVQNHPAFGTQCDLGLRRVPLGTTTGLIFQSSFLSQALKWKSLELF